jgi:GTP-binding protein YchF
VEKNTGTVLVPDERLHRIQELLKPEKLTPAHVEFVDIAGLVKGASQGEGLGNKFLSHVREASLMLHVLRAFSAGVVHPYGEVDPTRDAGIVEAELAIADLEVVERRLETLVKEPRTPEHEVLLHALNKTRTGLAAGFAMPALLPEEELAVRSFGLFSRKPMIPVLNCPAAETVEVGNWPGLAARNPFLFSSALETEMAEFTDAEKTELRCSLGLAPQGPAAIVEECFGRLGLIRYYTVKGHESRAWALPKGTPVIEAARQIHRDLAEGFIKAEVLAFSDLVACGDFAAARDLGKLKVEGKNYIVQDGDVILIKFRS